ncbi:bifunctional pyr operon transcriptional regulator/uracil phosphoribosyltransferase PyrR [Thiogranum longum]
MNGPYDIAQLIDQMADELRQKVDIDDRTAMVGIHTGGVWIARALHTKLGIKEPLGALDISFYRDDFTRIGMNPQVKPSELPFTLDDRDIILVDDVLHTGRTIRAAMNELFDYGRPASIVLATLVERSGRELPIEANVVGLHMEPGPGEHVKLSGPEPLKLEIKTDA